MHYYDKIETLFKREETRKHKVIYGSYRNPTVEMLKDIDWVFTEKVDGTNISVVWDGYRFSFRGRTEKSEIPKNLQEYLASIFDNSDMEQLFEQTFGDKEVIIFGEGYGKGIQKVGKDYNPNGVSFIVFDVMINGNYQSRDTVKYVASICNLNVVPVVKIGTLQDGIQYVLGHPDSTIGSCKMEGVVGRPKYELQDRCGNRIIVKIKWEDFKEYNNED